jgi:hypothetical protein
MEAKLASATAAATASATPPTLTGADENRLGMNTARIWRSVGAWGWESESGVGVGVGLHLSRCSVLTTDTH